jgi:hypothetical protein
MLHLNVFILACMCRKLMMECGQDLKACSKLYAKQVICVLLAGRQNFCSSRTAPQLAVSRRGYVRKSLTFQSKYSNGYESEVFFVIFISP